MIIIFALKIITLHCILLQKKKKIDIYIEAIFKKKIIKRYLVVNLDSETESVTL